MGEPFAGTINSGGLSSAGLVQNELSTGNCLVECTLMEELLKRFLDLKSIYKWLKWFRFCRGQIQARAKKFPRLAIEWCEVRFAWLLYIEMHFELSWPKNPFLQLFKRTECLKLWKNFYNWKFPFEAEIKAIIWIRNRYLELCLVFSGFLVRHTRSFEMIKSWWTLAKFRAFSPVISTIHLSFLILCQPQTISTGDSPAQKSHESRSGIQSLDDNLGRQ